MSGQVSRGSAGEYQADERAPLSLLCLRETWPLGEAESCLQVIRGRQIILHPVFAIAHLNG